MKSTSTYIIYNESFIQNGYLDGIKIDSNIVQSLYEYYQSLSKPKLEGFHPTLMWDNAQKKEEISQYICNQLQEVVDSMFPNHRILYGNFMVKEPGTSSKMKLHQDWAYIDEHKNDSYAIWLPLQDLNEQNGALHMIPGSQRFKNGVRGPGVYCPFYNEHQWLQDNFGTALYLKSGEAVIWQHQVLHYSPPNLSETSRIAATAIIVPKDETILHYFKPEDEEMVEVYEIEDDFFFHYKIGSRPQKKAQLKKKIIFKMDAFKKDELKKILGSDLQHKESFWKRLFSKK